MIICVRCARTTFSTKHARKDVCLHDNIRILAICLIDDKIKAVQCLALKNLASNFI
jgi:hypothetical protein